MSDSDNEELKAQIGQRLRAVRFLLGYGRTEEGFNGRARFAEVMFIHEGRLAKYEAGHNFPAVEFLVELHRRYGIPESYVLSGSLAAMPADVQQALQREERAIKERAVLSRRRSRRV